MRFDYDAVKLAPLVGTHVAAVAVAFALGAQGARDLVNVGTHVIPVAVLATKAARDVRTELGLGRMAELSAYVATARATLDRHVVELEDEL